MGSANSCVSGNPEDTADMGCSSSKKKEKGAKRGAPAGVAPVANPYQGPQPIGPDGYPVHQQMGFQGPAIVPHSEKMPVPAEPNYPVYVGKYDYDSRTDDDLSFKKGRWTVYIDRQPFSLTGIDSPWIRMYVRVCICR